MRKKEYGIQVSINLFAKKRPANPSEARNPYVIWTQEKKEGFLASLGVTGIRNFSETR
jgi:hypothetical protein